MGMIALKLQRITNSHYHPEKIKSFVTFRCCFSKYFFEILSLIMVLLFLRTNRLTTHGFHNT